MEIGATTIRTLLMETEGRQPTVRQVRAVENLVENGGKNKGEAIREAGYSEAIVKNPDRVFGSPTVKAVLEKLGVPDESEAVIAIKRNLKAKYPVNFVFPPFNSQIAEADDEDAEPEGDEPVNEGQKFGEQMTDDQIRAYLREGGIIVSKVVHGERSRRFYGYADNPKAQLSAADMLLKVLGAYAPDKVIGKHTMSVGVMSMRELREKMRENVESIVQAEVISVSK